MARLPTVSLFTGCGGLDLGLEAAGFANTVAVEMEDIAVRSLMRNRERWGEVLHGSIHDLIDAGLFERRADKVLRASGLREGEAALLAGGPPCQPFSKSGYWSTGDSKRLGDPRARTMDAYFDVLATVLPKAYLLENVPGLKFHGKSEGLDYIQRRLTAINASRGTNYSMAVRQLNCAHYGVPQARERVFVIGHRGGLEFNFPAPTHALPPAIEMTRDAVELGSYEVPDGLVRATNAWDAIGHLQDDPNPELLPKGKWAPVLATIPEGFNYLWHTPRNPRGVPLWGWRRAYYSMLLKIAKSRPCWTLTAKPGQNIGPFHWKSRRFSTAELKALQTFPADYEVVGDVLQAHLQLGNAVPSLMAEVLGCEIRRQFYGHAVTGGLRLLPKQREDLPAPDPALPASSLPERILALCDISHTEHPGTGKGRGALARQADAVAP